MKFYKNPCGHKTLVDNDLLKFAEKNQASYCIKCNPENLKQEASMRCPICMGERFSHPCDERAGVVAICDNCGTESEI